MRRRLAWVLVAMILFLPVCQASEAEFRVDAKGAVLIDATSGRVLYGQNMNETLPMASTTKIMTALLALENATLTEDVTASANASGVPGTSIYLSKGETLSMEHMLYGLMLRSGNDAAVAIAEHISGSVRAFAEKMNQRASELGADAHYVNPHGLDAAGHSASALGLAKIMRACMQLESFRTITATKKKVIPWEGNEYSRVLENKNRLLSSYEGATGGKTGYTSKAGRCLVFSAKRDGMELIGVVLSCPTWFDTATVLLDYGFENYGLKTALTDGQFAVDVPVSGGAKNTVPAVAQGNLAGAVGISEHYSVTYDLYEMEAPVNKGQRVGTGKLMINGESVATCPLIAGESVAEGGFFRALRRILSRWGMMFQPAENRACAEDYSGVTQYSQFPCKSITP